MIWDECWYWGSKLGFSKAWLRLFYSETWWWKFGTNRTGTYYVPCTRSIYRVQTAARVFVWAINILVWLVLQMQSTVIYTFTCISVFATVWYIIVCPFDLSKTVTRNHITIHCRSLMKNTEVYNMILKYCNILYKISDICLDKGSLLIL